MRISQAINDMKKPITTTQPLGSPQRSLNSREGTATKIPRQQMYTISATANLATSTIVKPMELDHHSHSDFATPAKDARVWGEAIRSTGRETSMVGSEAIKEGQTLQAQMLSLRTTKGDCRPGTAAGPREKLDKSPLSRKTAPKPQQIWPHHIAQRYRLRAC